MDVLASNSLDVEPDVFRITCVVPLMLAHDVAWYDTGPRATSDAQGVEEVYVICRPLVTGVRVEDEQKH